jgi:hypothetical protein
MGWLLGRPPRPEEDEIACGEIALVNLHTRLKLFAGCPGLLNIETLIHLSHKG